MQLASDRAPVQHRIGSRGTRAHLCSFAAPDLTVWPETLLTAEGTATLHNLRQGVATHLVSNGQILKAQARLGHREASTTLRNYAHAIPLDDADVAESIEALLANDDNAE